jgi:hypothetical protein
MTMTMTRVAPMLARVRLLTPATAAIAATAATAATQVTLATATQAIAAIAAIAATPRLAEDLLLVQWIAKTVDTPTLPMSTTIVL